MQTNIKSFFSSSPSNAVQNKRAPPRSWNPIDITYDDLVKLHPTPKGIRCDQEGEVVSIQMVVPNVFDYDDAWFDDAGLHYKTSKGDEIGNEGLAKAYDSGRTFRLYCRYKGKEKEKLEKLGLQKYAGKNYDLRNVRIVNRILDEYIIVQA